MARPARPWNLITSAGVTLGGSALSSSLTSLPANPANGSGSTPSLAAGTYVLVATDSNGPAASGGSNASATVTVTVTSGNCSAPTVTTTANFSGNTSACQNNPIWFSSTVAVNGIGAKGGVLQFNNAAISFTANGSPVTLIAPAALITFSPTATTATSTYDAPSNTWNTVVPAGYTGNVFLTGLTYQAPARFSAANNPVTWSGSFLGSAQGMVACNGRPRPPACSFWSPAQPRAYQFLRREAGGFRQPLLAVPEQRWRRHAGELPLVPDTAAPSPAIRPVPPA